MRKRIIVVILFSFILITLFGAKAFSAKDAITGTLDRMDSLDSSSSEDIIREWLDRIELSIQLETNKKPTFYFQTVQPLYQSFDKINTLFIQPRVSWRQEECLYNLGVGFRKLLSEDLLLGINFFADYEGENEHGRAGLGFEALGQILEARLNGYFGVTHKRLVQETSSSKVYERAVDGMDFELGMPLPYLPWLKLYGSGFWYDFEKFKDKYGWKGRLEARLSEALCLEVYSWDDNKGKREYGGRIRFNLAFDTFSDFINALKFSHEPFPRKDLRKQTLIPVERSFEITVERWSESKTGGMTMEIGRK